MKKITIVVLALLLSLSHLLSYTAKKEKVEMVTAPSYLDAPTKNQIPVTTPPIYFQQGANGYGWYQGNNNKIDYDPETETFASVYRQKHSAGSGTAGISWGYFGEDEFEDSEIVHTPEEGYAGTRYPFAVSGYGYHFNVSTEYNLAGSDQSRIYITIMGEDGEFSEVKAVTPSGITFSGWRVQADITFNEATGEYILAICGENNLNSDPSHFAALIGKSTDPLDPDSWSFSDYNDLSFMAEKNNPNPGTGTFFECHDTPKVHWGKDGFGIIIAHIQNEDENYNSKSAPGYIYTTNYGETWVTDNGKFFWNLEMFETSFEWWGSLASTPEGDLPINMLTPYTNMKVVIDDDNVVHFVHALRAGPSTDDTNYYRTVINNDDQPISGIYHTALEIDTTTGAPTYNSNYIATFGGLHGSEAFGDYDIQYYYVNTWNLSIGISENGILYTGWLDRPILDENSVINPWLAGDANTTRFIADPYFSYSNDGGENWEHSETPEGHEGLFYGFNLFNTPDNHEEGFDLMSKTKSTNETGGNSLMVYSVWQEADLSQPLPSPSGWHEHVQDYKMAKIYVTTGSDVVEEVPTSISLKQNYPNPFNPTTSISYSLNCSSNVNLTVYNAAGEEVIQLVDRNQTAGNHSVQFDGSNLNSGVYFYKLTVDGISDTKKMVLTK